MEDPMELDALLYQDGDVAEDRMEDPAPVPPDIDVAAWHNRKGAVYRDQMAAAQRLFGEEIVRLRERLDGVLRPLERAAGWHEAAVEAWHRQNVKTVGKTVTFPSGPRSELRASQPVVNVTNEDALRAFLADRVDPETGETLERKVYVRQPDRYMVSELKAVAEIPKLKGGREPNSVAQLVLKGGEVPVEVPGVVAVITRDRWQKGSK